MQMAKGLLRVVLISTAIVGGILIGGTLVAAARVFLCFFGNGARVGEKCRARLRAKCRFLRSARKKAALGYGQTELFDPYF